MHVAVRDLEIPAKIVLDADRALSDDEFFEFCQANPDLNIERTAQGEIVIMPPAGNESDYRSVDVVSQLKNWAKRKGHGKVFGSSAEFLLRMALVARPTRLGFQTNRSRDSRKKSAASLCAWSLNSWLRCSRRAIVFRLHRQRWRNGWRTTRNSAGCWMEISERYMCYRPGKEPEIKIGIAKLKGEGPVKGFVLHLESIWEGL